MHVITPGGVMLMCRADATGGNRRSGARGQHNKNNCRGAQNIIFEVFLGAFDKA